MVVEALHVPLERNVKVNSKGYSGIGMDGFIARQ
jgi:hypothetical protein